MKKTLLALSLLGVVSLFQACSDGDKSKTSCNVDEYEAGCANGVYLTCEYDSSRDGLGFVVEHATITIDGVEYRCNGDIQERVDSDIHVRPKPGDSTDPDPGTNNANACKVDEYESGCANGVYRTCESDGGSNGLGHVVELATITIDRVDYRCNAADQLEKVNSSVQERPKPNPDPEPEPEPEPEPSNSISCKDGVIVGTSSISAIIDNVLYRCDGDAYDSYECNADFVNGCYGNLYVDCNKGKFSQHRSYTANDFTFICRKDIPVLSGLKCENDIFTDYDQHFLAVADNLYVCNGSQISNVSSKYNSACDGTKRYYFDSEKGIYKMDDCAGSAHICEEYQKGNLIYAACVNEKDVTEGCGTANLYGNCDKNVLVICSSEDKDKGKTLRINCREQSISKSCILVEDDYGYDCATECAHGRNQYTDFGTCDGNVLKYCTQSGEYDQVECNACGFNGSYYDCM